MLFRFFSSAIGVWLVTAANMVGAAAAGSAEGEPSLNQQYLIRQWTTEDELPQNTVTRLVQTRDGYLWVGTRAGVARFDGVKFTVFMRELQIDDSDPLSCEEMWRTSMARYGYGCGLCWCDIRRARLRGFR